MYIIYIVNLIIKLLEVNIEIKQTHIKVAKYK